MVRGLVVAVIGLDSCPIPFVNANVAVCACRLQICLRVVKRSPLAWTLRPLMYAGNAADLENGETDFFRWRVLTKFDGVRRNIFPGAPCVLPGI